MWNAVKPHETERRRGRLGRLTGGAAALVALAGCLASAAVAQQAQNPNRPTRFDAAPDQAADSDQRIEELNRQKAQLAREQALLQLEAVKTAREVQRREAALTGTETRLRQLMSEENKLLGELRERQNALSTILAALQLMERNKPPALVVKPNDAVDAARTAMLLGSILPKLQTQADELGSELQALVSLRQGILDQREQLARDRESLEADRLRLSELMDQKKAKEIAVSRQLEVERLRARQLASRAHDIESVIREIDERARGKIASIPNELPTSLHPTLSVPRPTATGQIRRLVDVKGKLRPPVTGTLVRRFQEKDRAGQLLQGVTLRTRPGAQVVAPFDCRIMFAQPYKGYGQLLILSTSDGYHFVLAGMSRIYGVEGQTLLEGEPVGVMGAAEEDVQVFEVPRGGVTGDALQANAGPELYFEIRENGKPINPLPWLATARLERTTQ